MEIQRRKKPTRPIHTIQQTSHTLRRIQFGIFDITKLKKRSYKFTKRYFDFVTVGGATFGGQVTHLFVEFDGCDGGGNPTHLLTTLPEIVL